VSQADSHLARNEAELTGVPLPYLAIVRPFCSTMKTAEVKTPNTLSLSREIGQAEAFPCAVNAFLSTCL
jgi:hypothetical protein